MFWETSIFKGLPRGGRARGGQNSRCHLHKVESEEGWKGPVSRVAENYYVPSRLLLHKWGDHSVSQNCFPTPNRQTVMQSPLRYMLGAAAASHAPVGLPEREEWRDTGQ